METISHRPHHTQLTESLDTQLCCSTCGEITFVWCEARRRGWVRISEQHGTLVVRELTTLPNAPRYRITSATLRCAACDQEQAGLLHLLGSHEVTILNAAFEPLIPTAERGA
jgi:hypothetical protein